MIQKCCVIVSLLFLTTLLPLAKGQDAETVKKLALASIARVDNHPTIVAKGKYETHALEGTTSFSVRGDEFWEEYNHTSKDLSKERQDKDHKFWRRIMGTELPIIRAFDGKNTYLFVPSGLRLEIQPMRTLKTECPEMLPKYWNAMGQALVRFQDTIQNKRYEPTVEELGNGRWKFSKTGIGKDIKNATAHDMQIIVDAKYDYLVTEYEGGGGMLGQMTGRLEWEKNDEGFWYVKHGKRLVNGRLKCEWYFDEISFDAKKCRSRFNDLETVVPFATNVLIYDANKKLVTERYIGGQAGEEEFRLRKLALSNNNRLPGE